MVKRPSPTPGQRRSCADCCRSWGHYRAAGVDPIRPSRHNGAADRNEPFIVGSGPVKAHCASFQATALAKMYPLAPKSSGGSFGCSFIIIIG